MIPFLSPLRYPGGKNWLREGVSRWIDSIGSRPRVFVEPFAGGASISLHVLAFELVDQAIIVERDPALAAFWRVVLGKDCAELRKLVEGFVPTEETVSLVDGGMETGDLDVAFRVLVRNRVNFGGIIKAGAGRLRQGENGKGLLSRWNPGMLTSRLCAVNSFSHRIRLIEGDGLQELRKWSCTDTVAFVDPPYIGTARAAGKRLYTFNSVEPKSVFECCAAQAGHFLMTHEADPIISEFAESYNFAYREIRRIGRSHFERGEFLVSRDMAWFDHLPLKQSGATNRKTN